MKPVNKYIVAFITAFLGIGYLFWYLFVQSKHDQHRSIGAAFVIAGELGIFLVAGLLFIFFPRTKFIGQGIFLGTLITLIIGFGVCTAAS
jgi:hypothetical protein